MEIVILFWGILISVIFVQIYVIVYYIRKGVLLQYDDAYSEETIKVIKIIVEALQTNKIKKHIITNSAPVYDSPKTLMQFQTFLKSELMQDIQRLSEEAYDG